MTRPSTLPSNPAVTSSSSRVIGWCAVLLIGCALVPARLSAQTAAAAWHDDYDRAAALARKSGKDVLLVFTGTDWCPWCRRLEAEVLGHREFRAAAAARFELVKLEFPRDAAGWQKLAKPWRYQQLADQYAIDVYPSVLIVDATGAVLARTGYQKGGVAPYRAHLDQLLAAGRKLRERIERLRRQVGEGPIARRAVALREALGLLAPIRRPEAGSTALLGIAEAAFTIDPTNAQGLLHQAIGVALDTGIAPDPFLEAVRRYDPRNRRQQRQAIALALVGKRAATPDDARRLVAELDALAAANAVLAEATRFGLYRRAALLLDRLRVDPEAAKRFAGLALQLRPPPEARAALRRIAGR
ncbi:MAG: thioredoxin family protein [Planctomycetes bacterium]|nr:thioredoxin family protein [Planctomycetota bacterium]